VFPVPVVAFDPFFTGGFGCMMLLLSRLPTWHATWRPRRAGGFRGVLDALEIHLDDRLQLREHLRELSGDNVVLFFLRRRRLLQRVRPQTVRDAAQSVDHRWR